MGSTDSLKGGRQEIVNKRPDDCSAMLLVLLGRLAPGALRSAELAEHQLSNLPRVGQVPLLPGPQVADEAAEDGLGVHELPRLLPAPDQPGHRRAPSLGTVVVHAARTSWRVGSGSRVVRQRGVWAASVRGSSGAGADMR